LHRWLAVALACLALGSCAKPAPQKSSEVVVAAAASLRGVLPEIASSYEKTHPGTRITATFGASGELRQQVVAGAPIDVVAFAGSAPVDDLVARGLLDPSTRRVIATNALVLIGPKGCPRVTFATLARVPPGDKIAIGDPRSVPAGQYAKAALERLAEWDALESRLVYGSDVSAVLAYARHGEVAAAVVYKTELHGVSDVDLLDELPDGIAPRAEVVVALVAGSREKEAAASFLADLEGAPARKALDAYGFGPP
jgi:molybdate transport system substrate-binding protein